VDNRSDHAQATSRGLRNSKDGALFPNQFALVQPLLMPRKPIIGSIGKPKPGPAM